MACISVLASCMRVADDWVASRSSLSAILDSSAAHSEGKA